MREGRAMLAMLRKDIYVMGKYTAVYAAVWIVILAGYAQFPGLDASFFYTMPALCALTVVLNAVSVDQDCRWDRFAAMTPLAPWVLVLERYLFAYGLFVLMALLGAVASQLAAANQDWVTLWTIAVLLLLALAMSLPLAYRFGRRKGGLLMMAIWGAIAAVILGSAFWDYAILEAAFGWMERLPAWALALGLAGALTAVHAVSILLSIRFYIRRQRGRYG